MFERRIPEWLRHSPSPSMHGFATLAGFEAITRGMLISVYPVALYEALQDAALISSIYFAIGIVSLLTGLSVPFLTRFVPRRWVYGMGATTFIFGSLLGMWDSPAMLVASVTLNTIATVITFVCFNAYVLDYITRTQLGRCETLRMVYSAAGWTIGPVLGVLLWGLWHPAPFLIAAISSALMLAAFVWLRMGNGKHITRARGPAPNPLAFLGQFLRQPRLIAGWLFAVIRSCGWWAYIVYLPIFAVKSGFSDQLGGALLSITNAGLFAAPLILRFVQATSIRTAVRTGFLTATLLFSLAGLGIIPPGLAIAALFVASFFLILLDICGGLPFLMAVKPSERTEMSAIYSSYRDFSGIATPGIAWLVLLAAPVSGIFAATGGACLLAFAIAGRLHPRLGQGRLKPPAPAPIPAPNPTPAE